MMMMSRQSHEHSPKYVHFANGFPPKELIPAQGLSSGVNMHGGVFVGLHEEATSKLTRSQRTIPPLAKCRANYFPVKHRVSSSRYRDVANPFDAHKGTEKIGFTPQAIKRSKPKLERTSARNAHTATHIPSNPANNSNMTSKLSRQSVCPVSTLLHGNDAAPRNPSEANSRILFDVEKEG
ncbi:uncharacterized protein LOC116288120, partial [Actinia tenebrosa]|uniref:Uncharacterized protein LOC116288120 n=1 Tax=Actinia tenebrosa TaxID=6105 RepID=A0A6P8H5I0_ACTTE